MTNFDTHWHARRDEAKAVRRAALAWLKRELNWELDDLPKGVRGEAQFCPIANALTMAGKKGAAVQGAGMRYYERSGVLRKRDTPDEIRRFISWFDGNEFPDLVAWREGEDVQ